MASQACYVLTAMGRQLKAALSSNPLALLARASVPIGLGVGVYLLLRDTHKDEPHGDVPSPQSYLQSMDYVSTIFNSNSTLPPIDFCVRFTETVQTTEDPNDD
eukprot:21361-Heterococcus_DN1.PRE.6